MPKFPKSERILKSADFSFAYKKGRKFSAKNFRLNFLSGEKKRLGITVSRSVGKANVRNKIKRVIREYFRLNKDIFPVGDNVITANASADKLSPTDIRIELAKLVKKVL